MGDADGHATCYNEGVRESSLFGQFEYIQHIGDKCIRAAHLAYTIATVHRQMIVRLRRGRLRNRFKRWRVLGQAELVRVSFMRIRREEVLSRIKLTQSRNALSTWLTRMMASAPEFTLRKIALGNCPCLHRALRTWRTAAREYGRNPQCSAQMG